MHIKKYYVATWKGNYVHAFKQRQYIICKS